MKDNEKIKELIKLSEENPELDIIPMVYTDCVPSDDFVWWGASFGKSEIKEYYIPDENYILGENEIKEKLSGDFTDDPDAENLSEEDFDKIINDRYEELKASGEIQTAIFVEINTP